MNPRVSKSLERQAISVLIWVFVVTLNPSYNYKPHPESDLGNASHYHRYGRANAANQSRCGAGNSTLDGRADTRAAVERRWDLHNDSIIQKEAQGREGDGKQQCCGRDR